MPPDPSPATVARDSVLSENRAVLADVLAAADGVASDWSTLPDGRRATPDRDAVVGPLRSELDQRGHLARLPDLLTGAVDAAGYRLPAAPVPAPPYVAITSTGPVLRGTVDDGRLVLAVDCFEVVRDSEPNVVCGSGSVPGVGDESGGGAGSTGLDAPRVVYARTATTPEAALSVRFRSDSN